MAALRSIATIFGIYAVGVVISIIAAYQLFKWLGSKWIEAKFSERLESYKADQARELERLKHNINSVFDRARRLHDKEFAILPDLWAKTVDSYYATQAYVHGMNFYPDVSRTPDDVLEEIMDKREFSASEKKQVLESSERLTTFIAVSDHHQNIDTQRKLRAFAQTLKKDGIFIDDDIKVNSNTLLDVMQDVITAHNFEKQHKRASTKAEEIDERFSVEGKALFEKLEKDITQIMRDAKTLQV